MFQRMWYGSVSTILVSSAAFAASSKPPTDDYRARVQQIIDQKTAHTFRAVSVEKVDQETHLQEGAAKIRVKGVAELTRDAYGRGRDGAYLSLASYWEAPPTEQHPSAGQAVVYAKWSKGTKVEFEGAIEWYRSDEGWREGPATNLHHPPLTGGPSPVDYIIRCFHSDGLAEYHSEKPYLDPRPPAADECQHAIEEMLVKTNYSPFIKPENVTVAFPYANSRGGVGADYRSAPVTFRGVFKVPTVFMGGNWQFVPAPTVGAKVPISAREADFEMFGQFFAPNDSVSCESTITITRDWQYDRWTIDVLGVKIPNPKSPNGVRVKFAQEAAGVVYGSVEIIQH